MKATRSRQSNTSKDNKNTIANSADGAATDTVALAASIPNPPNVFILPRDRSLNARIISAKISRTAEDDETRRYLVCPQKGFYEFTRIAAPKTACRSWLLAQQTSSLERSIEPSTGNGDANQSSDQLSKITEADVLRSPSLLVATPLDPLFFLLASDGVLWPNITMGNAEYLDIDTRLGMLRSQNEHLDQVMRDDKQRQLEERLKDRIIDVCDVQVIPGEDMDPAYSMSLSKLYEQLVKTAGRVVKRGMPPSIEARFVEEPLRIPEQIVSRAGADSKVLDQQSDSPGDSELHSSLDSSAKAVEASEELRSQLRIRRVTEYLMAAYLPLDLRKALEKHANDKRSEIASSTGISCDALDRHLEKVNALKKEAQALRSLSDNISRKRSGDEEEEAHEKAEAKRRKKEEDDAKKKNMSRGVQQLAKADTSGMKKLSAFFSKPVQKKIT